MLTSVLRLALSGLSISVLFSALVLGPSVQSKPAPVQTVPLLQTAAGPVVSGPFGRFVTPVPDATCGTRVSCPQGSHAGVFACCNDNSKPITAPGCGIYFCNYSFCGSTEKPTCCAGGCIMDYPPECVGCERTGVCTH